MKKITSAIITLTALFTFAGSANAGIVVNGIVVNGIVVNGIVVNGIVVNGLSSKPNQLASLSNLALGK